MADFDPNKFSDMLDDYIEIADANIQQEYKRELNALHGLTPDQVKQFGGTTTQLNDIIAEVEKARDQNLKQAALIANLKQLGQSTYNLAQKISALVP